MRADRECVWDGPAIDCGKGRSFPWSNRHCAGAADREVAFSRRDVDAGPLHLHFNPAKPAIQIFVGWRVSEQIVVVQVVLDPIEPLTQVIGIVEEKATSVLCQLTQARAWILTEHGLIFLHRLGQWVVSARARIPSFDAAATSRINLIADL